MVRLDGEIKNTLKTLVNDYKDPIDEKELQVLIVEGIVPKPDEMLFRIKREI